VSHTSRKVDHIYTYIYGNSNLSSLGHRRTIAQGVVVCIDIILYTYIILYVTVYYYYYYYYYCCCFARGDSAGGEKERESASEREIASASCNYVPPRVVGELLPQWEWGEKLFGKALR